MLRSRWAGAFWLVALVICGLGGSVARAEDGAAPAATNYNKDLLAVEQRVDGLKEQVFQSKATLQLLKEIVEQGSSAGARVTVWHVNRLGQAFKMQAITYLIDGQARFSKVDNSGALSDSKEFKIHDGSVPPGNHTVSVDFKLRPTGFGVFRYAQDYEVDVRSSYSFDVEVGKQCTVRAIINDRGSGAASFEERAKVDFELKCERISE